MHFFTQVCYNGNMENNAKPKNNVEQMISDVQPGSPADRYGLCRGDVLCTLNDQPVIDIVDYEYLTANPRLTLTVRSAAGRERTLHIHKQEYEPLGLSFATSMMDNLRTCRNHCIFCFVDQMPRNVRTSLQVKDDDWRMSFIMGNYVSLTNVDDAELQRMIDRRVSPLYVSLHATDPEIRVQLMKNPNAGRVMEQLQKLKAAGIRFHLQVVLCPGINDGDILRKTLADVESLWPAAQSLAIVPVGLTRYRDGLPHLRCYTRSEAVSLINELAPLQSRYLEAYGTRLVFLSDEWYILAEQELPPYSFYEEFGQIENGVGLLRLFEDEFLSALAERNPLLQTRKLTVAGGVSAERFMRPLLEKLRPYGIEIRTVPILNHFFGEQITVAGLITGQDLIGQLANQELGEALLIPHNLLREQEDVFLDNMTLSEAEAALHTRILPFADGEELINLVFGSNK